MTVILLFLNNGIVSGKVRYARTGVATGMTVTTAATVGVTRPHPVAVYTLDVEPARAQYVILDNEGK